MLAPTAISVRREPWNKDKLVGQKAPLKIRDIWAIRVRLEMTDRKRELALFNLAIDSKLRGCDLVQRRVRDVAHGDRIAARTIVMQQQTQRPEPVQFEITEPTARPYSLGFGLPTRPKTICFRADYDCPHIYRPGNTPTSSRRGSLKSAWTRAPMEPTQCAAQQPP
jgi:hypothetical protein